MNHEQTRIYQQALELVSNAHKVIVALPLGCGFLADQLRRASASVALNFAEGYDKGSLAEQRRFFRMARCSAQEVAADGQEPKCRERRSAGATILDVASRLHAIQPAVHATGKELCDHIVRMLYRFRA